MDFLNNALLAPVYYAGLFDGEGSVQLYEQNTNPRVWVKITTTFHPAIMYPLNKFGGYIENNKASQNPQWKDVFTWKVYGNRANEFLRWIQPYTIVKRDQIDLVVDYWKLYRPGSIIDASITDQYIATLKALKRGK